MTRMARKTKSADHLNAPEPPSPGAGGGHAAAKSEPAIPERATARPQQKVQPLPEGMRRLRKAWAKADDEARGQFLAWLSKKGHLQKSGAAPVPSPSIAPIASGRYLLAETVERIARRMAEEGLSPGDLALHLGFPTEGAAVERALRQGAALRLTVVAALSAWLSQPPQKDADPSGKG